MTEVWEELGITKEEYKKKHAQWIDTNQRAIASARKVLLNHLKLSLLNEPSQHQQRRWSWAHIWNLEDPEYADKWREVLKKLNPPLLIAASNQERAHLEHFINSIGLSLIQPGKTPGSDKQPVTLQGYVEVEQDLSTRIEGSTTTFSILKEMIPKSSGSTKDTFQRQVIKKLDTIQETLNAFQAQKE